MGLKIFTDFDQAADARGDGVVNGVIREDGTPVYFVTKRDIPEQAMRELSFEAYHGRPMDEYQRYCLREAMADR